MELTRLPFVTLIDEDTHEARSTVVSWVDSKSLGDVIRENVDMPVSTLHTDAAKGYIPVGRTDGWSLLPLTTRPVSTRLRRRTARSLCENYFAQLKRGLKGTHIHVDPKHLQRYLGEFDYRYSTFELTDTERMADLASRVAGRLTYKVVTALGSLASPGSGFVLVAQQVP